MALTIGELAATADISTSAIRYYEEEGLLPAPQRVSGQRRYPDEAVVQLKRLVNARRLGFSIAELRLLFHEYEARPLADRWKTLAEQKLPELDDLIKQAQLMKQVLEIGLSCVCNTIFDCFEDAEMICEICDC